MSEKLYKQFTNSDQLSLPFDSSANNISNNLIRFDNNRRVQSSKNHQERERIINKLLFYADNLRW